MNQDQIKAMLLDIEESKLEFSVTLTGKESKRVNGLYKPDTCEILLHNKNFTSDNQMIYTAIHEYAHHLLNEEKLEESAGLKPSYQRVHTNQFWARFHGLLEVAEEKGYYVIGLENSPELAELTEDIRKNYLEANGRLMQEFGQLLAKAYKLCQDAGIRYEDYIDRVLKMPRCAATSITKVAAAQVNPALGFENIKLVASMPQGKRQDAEEQLLGGHSPDSVRAMMKKKAESVDQKTKLEQEKKRLEKTIQQLTSRLEFVEESLASL